MILGVSMERWILLPFNHICFPSGGEIIFPQDNEVRLGLTCSSIEMDMGVEVTPVRFR